MLPGQLPPIHYHCVLGCSLAVGGGEVQALIMVVGGGEVQALIMTVGNEIQVLIFAV